MKTLNFYPLEICELNDLARFVIEENYAHHKCPSQKQFELEVSSVYEEELNLNNSKIFVTKNNTKSIVGSIRVLKWNFTDLLPIQKLFGINPMNVIDGRNQIYHIGRFAIKKGIDNRGFNIFKTLMLCAISEVCKSRNSHAFAECDAKLLRILNLLGIEAKVLAPSINYLGSETIPVLLTYKSLKEFLDKNDHLLPQNLTPVHQSVVLKKTA